MPRYNYYCDSCQTEFEASHSIKEKLEKCELCGADDSLEKLPSIPTILTKNKQGKDKKVGSLVEEHIEENREILKKEKERLKEVEYK
tara:strand:- start:508 stop:768 length:261 start_codon:yes stop_codon:yes gene_type:complete